MKTKSVEREKVGIMLALGYTRKEIATKTGKSINTVCKQSDNLYKLSDCRNLADFTRFMIKRYTGIPVEDILLHAMHDITICAALFLITTAANTYGAWDVMKAAIADFATSLSIFFKQ